MPETSAEVVITARYEDQAGPGIERLRDDLDALGNGAESFAAHREELVRGMECLEEYRSRYVDAMGEMAQITRTALECYVAGSFMAAAKALSVWISGAKGGAKQFAKAMLELSAQAVLAIGQQAAVKAVFALAEFFLFKDPMALKAAKLYGTVAGMAIITGAALMARAGDIDTKDSGSGSGSGGGGGGNHGGKSNDENDASGDRFTVNVHVMGHVVDTQAFVEDVVAPALSEAVGRGAASRSKYNIVTQRD